MDRDEALEFLRDEFEYLRKAGIPPRDWLKKFRDAIAALSSPCACGGEPAIRIVRLTFDRHTEGHFFFHNYISLPADAAPKEVNTISTIAAIWREAR